MGFLKNTFRFILIGIFFFISLWLFLLMFLYFSIDINKVKNYSKVFIEKNTNLNLGFDAVTISFFPTINLNYSNLVLSSKTDSTEIFKSTNLKIVINLYKFIIANFIIDVFFEDTYYNYTDYKIDFSDIPYTYASFLFFSKYNVYFNSLNILNDSINFLKVKAHIHIDPLKQEAYANSSINYLAYNFNLNTKFNISNKDIFESFIFTLNTKVLNNAYVFKGKVIKNNKEYILDDLIFNLNKENIKVHSYSFDLKDSLNLSFKVNNKLNNNLFSVFNFLDKYLSPENKELSYEAKLDLNFGKNDVYFVGEMLFNNVSIRQELKTMNVEKLLVKFKYLNDKLSLDINAFNKNTLIFKDSF